MSNLLKEAARLRAQADDLEKLHQAEIAAVQPGKTIYFHGDVDDPRLIVLDGGAVLLVDTVRGRIGNRFRSIEELRASVGLDKVYQTSPSVTVTMTAAEYPSPTGRTVGVSPSLYAAFAGAGRYF